MEFSPNHPQILSDRGLSYYRLGFLDLAEADISAAIAKAPAAHRFWWRGSMRFERGNYDSSAKDLLQAITLNPHPANPYREYGLTQWFLGNSGVASNLFSKYAAAEGKTEAQRNALLGNFRSDIDGAFNDITQAIALAPATGSRYQVRGIFHLIRGSYEAAYEDFSQQIALTPETEGGIEGGYLGLAAASALSGKEDEAVAVWQRAAGKRIWRPQLWLWSRLLGVQTGKDYDEYILQFSPKAWPHVLTRYYLGQVGEAEVLKCGAHPNPQTARQQLAEAHFYIGALLASKSDLDAANKEFTETVNADTIWWPVRILAQKQLEMNWVAALPKGAAPPNSRP